MAEIEVKGQRSCEIWQSLNKDVNAHGVVIIFCRRLLFGRMTEAYKGINTFLKLHLYTDVTSDSVPWADVS